MKLLTELYFLAEGGNALKGANVERINRADIPATIKLISKLSQIPTSDLHPLGSVGKQPTSGDIDLAVDVNKYDQQTIHDKVISQIGDDYGVMNKGTRVSSYALPIGGDRSKGLVQVDLMYTTNPSWANFAYHSPGEKSKYKGVVRTKLLIGVGAIFQEPGIDYLKFDPTSGELIIKAGRTFDLGVGLRRIFQFRPTKKTGEYLKSMKTITIDEFKQMYPDVEIDGRTIIIDDPKKVVAMLFGRGVTPDDVGTAEQVIQLIKQKFSPEQQQQIFQKAADGLDSSKIELPPEMLEYAR